MMEFTGVLVVVSAVDWGWQHMMEVMIPRKHNCLYQLCTNSEHIFVLCFVLLLLFEICTTLERKYYLGDQIKRNEMGGACGMDMGEERCIQGCSGET
jgi:hypothetical protein